MIVQPGGAGNEHGTTYRLRCGGCQATRDIVTPAPVDQFLRDVKHFTRDHKGCTTGAS